ncbi:hypothetical protein C7974DRAFT_380156 [Boeremia exigua]|uniref:uncharacterized protein n=1 Tax=Boeremia exigua TaxID=749465 RepID=UPI001E8CBA74|nr:uncharacterized protein C7974DRAFT_380156 [Boeremia exigua]KAH6615303.1 hypothetical protein C7974DRAFT_380156 [Boeremia exigua]
MRLLIESRKLTIELASTKHIAVDRAGAETFVPQGAKEDPHIDHFDDIKSSQSSTDNKPSSETSDTSVFRYTQLSRRKSIHKRIGRVLLRISRMCSDAQCSVYAYQYGSGASELPAGESPGEGTASLYEMPGSFPRVELESQDVEKRSVPPYSTSMAYAQAAPEHLQGYYKKNQNATLRRAAPMSVANLSHLPRLEVPQSQYRVPRLISDHSPLTPSPISPITPVIDTNSGYSGAPNLGQYLDVISPCTIPKQSQIFACYGNWSHHGQQSPATPSTSDSYDHSLSYTTTPLSAYSHSSYPPSAHSPYPYSAHSSHQPWPQPQIERQPPMQAQTYSPMHCSQSSNQTHLAGANFWASNVRAQTGDVNNGFPLFQSQDWQSEISVASRPHGPTSQAQSYFEKQGHDSSDQLLFPHLSMSHTFEDVPPAYSPVASEPQPTIRNTQQRYQPAVCQHCGKIFTGKYGSGNCKRHVQQTHASIFDRAIHMCKMCMKTYNRADALRKHQWKKHRMADAKPNKRRERGS